MLPLYFTEVTALIERFEISYNRIFNLLFTEIKRLKCVLCENKFGFLLTFINFNNIINFDKGG